MKKILICLLTAMVFLLSACAGDKDVTTAYPTVNEVEGVSLSIKEGTLKKTEATFLLENNAEEPVTYSTFEFHLEEKTDDNWKEYTGTAQSAWGNETTTLEAGQTAEIFINWKTLCGPGSKGNTYRMIIMVNNQPMAVEYVIE